MRTQNSKTEAPYGGNSDFTISDAHPRNVAVIAALTPVFEALTSGKGAPHLFAPNVKIQKQ